MPDRVLIFLIEIFRCLKMFAQPKLYFLADFFSQILLQMDGKEFRQRGREMVDCISEYLETVENRKIAPKVEPGFLHSLIPKEAPFRGENWDAIMSDVEQTIMPGV